MLHSARLTGIMSAGKIYSSDAGEANAGTSLPSSLCSPHRVGGTRHLLCRKSCVDLKSCEQPRQQNCRCLQIRQCKVNDYWGVPLLHVIHGLFCRPIGRFHPEPGNSCQFRKETSRPPLPAIDRRRSATQPWKFQGCLMMSSLFKGNGGANHGLVNNNKNMVESYMLKAFAESIFAPRAEAISFCRP